MNENLKTRRKRAQELRWNATKEKRHLWYDFLKAYPVQFRRQFPIGPYIVDFYCRQAKLAVELDGSQHYEDAGRRYDEKRTAFLEREYGVRVLRFSNPDVRQQFQGVCAAIDRAVKERAAPSSVTACGGATFPGGEGFPRGEAGARSASDEGVFRRLRISIQGNQNL